LRHIVPVRHRPYGKGRPIVFLNAKRQVNTPTKLFHNRYSNLQSSIKDGTGRKFS